MSHTDDGDARGDVPRTDRHGRHIPVVTWRRARS